MPRWLWFLPVGAIVVAGALYAFRLGWLAANLTESDVIVAYAARYADLAGAGARPEHCVAVLGQEARVWISVICAPPGGAGWRFDVNRFGGLVRMRGPDTPHAAPPRT